MDIRHEELKAMSDVYLGEDYDKLKLQQVELLQLTLREKQSDLLQQYTSKEIGPDQYVSSVNTIVNETFAKCEEILGLEDFQRLFGVPRHALGGLIDREAFLRSQQ